MKKILISLFSVLILLTACSNPIQDDLLSYINDDITPLADLELEAMNAFDNVTGANYTDDETTYNTLIDEVVPIYSEFIDELETIMPDTDEVSKLHEQYIDAANLQHSAFVNILDALEIGDTELITEANQKLAEARQEIRTYEQNIKKLAEENNVELDMNE
ncbi:hypothetical protein [Cytobacillus praedii]|uniref:hypothetical protein n=1 Tax=Cytobacillus praedii TaxID=1742358 RepID=UPI002E210180|nr:hypothetical protein [Cytobacillus praedii]